MLYVILFEDDPALVEMRRACGAWIKRKRAI
jgi:hypothetical protein